MASCFLASPSIYFTPSKSWKLYHSCLPSQTLSQWKPSQPFPPTGIGTIGSSLRKINLWTRYPSTVLCSASCPNLSSSLEPDIPRKQEQSLMRIAGLIGLSTILSKIIGLLRETLLAAVFGMGPIVTAFNYSVILPGFFMAILGGVNGPFHVTMLAFLSKPGGNKDRTLVGKVSTVVGLVCGALGLALFVFAGPIIDATAPGLLVQGLKDGFLTRDLAVLQLRIMAPCALLAGLIGIGFGSLSAAGVHGLASLSPSLSSISIIAAVVLHTLRFGFKGAASENVTSGAISLALGTTCGALAQWFWQAKAQLDVGLAFFTIQFANPFRDKDLHEVLVVLLPAIVGSGMLQFATFTDLYFASFIPGAAAGLGYANLLVMAPLGVLSSSILLPMLPLFARLAEPSKWTELKDRVGQGILLVLVASLPMTATVITLSRPIVEITLQRFSFDAAASACVSSLLVYYVVGSAFYLTRDLLVQVFYALGDGHTPFCISVAAILMNALLDWVLVRVAGLGADGLVLATTLVNLLSAVALLMLLSERLGLPLEQWMQSALIMVGVSVISGAATQFSYEALLGIFPNLRALWLVKLCSVLLASGIGFSTFYVTLYILGRTGMSSLEELLQYHVHQHLI